MKLKRLVVAVLALGLLSIGQARQASAAIPCEHFIFYYSDSAHTTLVGSAYEWCDGTIQFNYGHSSPYRVDDACDAFCIPHWK